MRKCGILQKWQTASDMSQDGTKCSKAGQGTASETPGSAQEHQDCTKCSEAGQGTTSETTGNAQGHRTTTKATQSGEHCRETQCSAPRRGTKHDSRNAAKPGAGASAQQGPANEQGCVEAQQSTGQHRIAQPRQHKDTAHPPVKLWGIGISWLCRVRCCQLP